MAANRAASVAGMVPLIGATITDSGRKEDYHPTHQKHDRDAKN